MPSIESLAAFAAMSFVLIVVPGPSVMFVVSRAVALGRKAALLTVAGNAAGVYLQVVLVAFGLGAIVERSVFAFNVVKLAGAAYLVWLGIDSIRHRREWGDALEGASTERKGRSIFMEGLLVGVANPKAIVFFMAFLPQFITPGAAPAALQMGVLGVLFVAIALVSDSAWGLAAGTARQWFASSPRRMERMGGVGGLTMIGLGLHLVFSGKSD